MVQQRTPLARLAMHLADPAGAPPPPVAPPARARPGASPAPRRRARPPPGARGGGAQGARPPLQLPVRKALEQRVADFEKAFPGAKVEYDGVVEPNDNSEKFAILVAAGTMPDVSATHTAFLTQYHHFSDLAPVPGQGQVAQDGRLLPHHLPGLQGAGQRHPPPDRDPPRGARHGDVLRPQRRPGRRPARAGEGLDAQRVRGLRPQADGLEGRPPAGEVGGAERHRPGRGLLRAGHVLGVRGRVLQPGRKLCIIDQPQAREAFQYLADLVLKHHVGPSPAEQTASGLSGSQQAQFATGRFRMYASNQNTAPVGSNAVPFEWDIQALPQVPGKKRATRMAGNAYGVITAGKNKNPDLSWELVKFFVGEDGSRQQMEAGNFMSHKKAVEKWPETRAPARNGRVVFEVMESWARLGESPQGVGQGDGAHQPGGTRVLNGQQSIGELINIAKPEAEGILRAEGN